MQEHETEVQHRREVSTGNRFAFGKNWLSFIETVDEEKIAAATESMREFLAVDSLDNKSLLDIGSGSGLFSLAAVLLGAQVTSTDYDADSVHTTKLMRDRHYDGNHNRWRVIQSSVLDAEAMQSLGTFDYVYSWGVLMLTGDMRLAISNAADRVSPGGVLAISIYVETPMCSRWKRIKHFYCRSHRAIQIPMGFAFFLLTAVRQTFRGPYRSIRGMSRYHDAIDWLGGYPYESASKSQVVKLVGDKFRLDVARHTEPSRGFFGSGCAEYIFVRKDSH